MIVHLNEHTIDWSDVHRALPRQHKDGAALHIRTFGGRRYRILFRNRNLDFVQQLLQEIFAKEHDGGELYLQK